MPQAPGTRGTWRATGHPEPPPPAVPRPPECVGLGLAATWTVGALGGGASPVSLVPASCGWHRPGKPTPGTLRLGTVTRFFTKAQRPRTSVCRDSRRDGGQGTGVSQLLVHARDQGQGQGLRAPRVPRARWDQAGDPLRAPRRGHPRPTARQHAGCDPVPLQKGTHPGPRLSRAGGGRRQVPAPALGAAGGCWFFCASGARPASAPARAHTACPCACAWL